MITIRPSPLPRSTRFPDRYFNAVKTLAIWAGDAGIYGKQILRNAGLIKGIVIKEIAVANPPIKHMQKSVRYYGCK